MEISRNITVSEKSLSDAVEHYNSLEEQELINLTEQFNNEQPDISTLVGVMENEYGQELFDEFADYAITIWLAFKNEAGELPKVDLAVMDKVDKQSKGSMGELAKKMGLSKKEMEEKIETFNNALQKVKTKEDLQEFESFIQKNNLMEIADFIVNGNMTTPQENLFFFINDNFNQNPEADGPEPEKRDQAFVQLLFIANCFDEVINKRL